MCEARSRVRSRWRFLRGASAVGVVLRVSEVWRGGGWLEVLGLVRWRFGCGLLLVDVGWGRLRGFVGWDDIVGDCDDVLEASSSFGRDDRREARWFA